ncbi:MAG: hypothetical protein PUB19_08115 [Lachnospiraceae bacterium]|nr:hypothetical protein [Lachnospiraceae bacterium]
MEGIPKVFLTLCCLLALLLSSTGIVMAGINAGKADAFLSDAAIGVAEGNFQDEVIEAWVGEAVEHGYLLTYCKKDTNGDAYTDLVDMTLTYEYNIPFLKTQGAKHQLKTYAK